ncbi:MAG: ABC transporter ATP-binding protein [Nitrospirae bacterium]|nr:MAG: ABC transporter ATP-binding protein [Nitrospirota bacterium]
MEPAIVFDHVSKRYPYYQNVTAGLKSFVFNLHKNLALMKQKSFLVLNDISFEVGKGETFGIVGRNGSGKSTLLSLMAGVMRQDEGSARTLGRISSLLELGAGFHPDLSGIENIILHGILMGHTKAEMLEKVDRIVEFSELGDFIYQPLRTYSSGMHVRLGFSVAVHIDPEILLIDEALAVGDLNFQEKCLHKMQEFRDSGTTIVIVSHDLTAIIRLCDKVMWIDNGKVMECGKPKDVVIHYIRSLDQQAVMTISRDELEEAEPEAEEAAAETAAAGDAGSMVPEAPGPDAGTPEEPEAEVQEDVRIDTWWDSPALIIECEALISGNPAITFYEFLKRQFAIGRLEKGLMICNQLKGVEVVFVINNICKAFDVIDAESDVRKVIAGGHAFQQNTYEIFVCVDLLHRIQDLDQFLEKINRSLKSNGIVIALEYIGPAGYKRPESDNLIANMLGRLLRDSGADASPDWLFEHGAEPGVSGAGEEDQPAYDASVSSELVIPSLTKRFEVLAVRCFGGPLYDLLLERVIREDGLNGEKGSKFVKTVVQYEQALIKEKMLENNYAMILCRKMADE